VQKKNNNKKLFFIHILSNGGDPHYFLYKVANMCEVGGLAA
jgi:hypothetical protein